MLGVFVLLLSCLAHFAWLAKQFLTCNGATVHGYNILPEALLGVQSLARDLQQLKLALPSLPPRGTEGSPIRWTPSLSGTASWHAVPMGVFDRIRHHFIA